MWFFQAWARCWLLIVISFVLMAGNSRAQDVETFFVSAIPSQDLSRTVKIFSPFAAYLEDKLGVSVRFVPAASYETTVEAFVRGEVHLAWLGAWSGIKARTRVPGSHAIAQGAEDANFKTYFIANAKTGLGRSTDLPKDILGKSFQFGSRISTAGRLIPEHYIRSAFGMMPVEKIFSRIGFSESHIATLRAVQSGEFEAGAMDYRVFETERKAGRAGEDTVRVIWETPAFPDYHFCLRGGSNALFGHGFEEKVKQAILTLDDPAILAKFSRSSFIPADDKMYTQIEALVKEAEARQAASQ
jgi:phosphonate transport system substrate-binding protein